MGQSIWSPGSQQTPALPSLAPVQFVKGTVVAPGITWTGDTSTGIWSQANGYLNFAINGSNILTIDPTGFASFIKIGSAPELDVAAAVTMDLGSVISNTARITGAGISISSFGTNYKGTFIVRFAGACTLISSASLIVPGGLNLVTAAGDTCIISPKATVGTPDGWVIAGYVRAAYAPATSASSGGGTGSGTTGSGTDALFLEGDQLVTASYTVGQSAMISNALISVATPAVILFANTFVAGQPVRFTTTGTLPTGINISAQYFISSLGLTSSSFQIAATQLTAMAGTGSIATSGIQSGVHSIGKIKNAVITGPLVVITGASVTVPTGARLVIL